MGAGHCQWGGLTDRNILSRASGGGVGLGIYIETDMPIGPSAAAGDVATRGRKES